jgi:hypothetical protein
MEIVQYFDKSYLLKQETPHFLVPLTSSPHDENIPAGALSEPPDNTGKGVLRYGGISYPCFTSIDDVAISIFYGDSLHTRWIGTMVGFCESKASNNFTLGYRKVRENR